MIIAEQLEKQRLEHHHGHQRAHGDHEHIGSDERPLGHIGGDTVLDVVHRGAEHQAVPQRSQHPDHNAAPHRPVAQDHLQRLEQRHFLLLHNVVLTGGTVVQDAHQTEGHAVQQHIPAEPGAAAEQTGDVLRPGGGYGEGRAHADSRCHKGLVALLHVADGAGDHGAGRDGIQRQGTAEQQIEHQQINHSPGLGQAADVEEQQKRHHRQNGRGDDQIGAVLAPAAVCPLHHAADGGVKEQIPQAGCQHNERGRPGRDEGGVRHIVAEISGHRRLHQIGKELKQRARNNEFEKRALLHGTGAVLQVCHKHSSTLFSHFNSSLMGLHCLYFPKRLRFFRLAPVFYPRYKKYDPGGIRGHRSCFAMRDSAAWPALYGAEPPCKHLSGSPSWPVPPTRRRWHMRRLRPPKPPWE